MASITMAEAAKLTQDDLIKGVIENIVTVNPIFNVLPFDTIDGNAKKYNREKTLGAVQELTAVGDAITAKSASTYKEKFAGLTTLVGDAEVNGLIMAQNVGDDQVALQVAAKAKNIARSYQLNMVTADTGAGGGWDGMKAIVDEVVTEADNPQMRIDLAAAAFTFKDLDNLLMQVRSKDGQVDFMQMNEVQIRNLRELQRSVGGTQPEYINIAGVNVMTYAGVPIFRNDYIPSDLGVGTDESLIFAGNFDDGTGKVGIAGLTSTNNSGLGVNFVGTSETKDEEIYRVKWYQGFVSYNELGLACMTGVV